MKWVLVLDVGYAGWKVVYLSFESSKVIKNFIVKLR